MLFNKSSPPLSGATCEGDHIHASHSQLNALLDDPLWWPQIEDASVNRNDADSAATEPSQPCSPIQRSGEQNRNLRRHLAKAHFEVVVKTSNEQSEDSCAGSTCEQEKGAGILGKCTEDHVAPLAQTQVPPCFALFIRFNCNVTLVAQKLFASKMAVSIFGSGSVVVEQDEAIRILKLTKKGDRVYRRHVMLSVDRKHSLNVKANEPFSYGFLATSLNALPPKARELVLSEKMPFGAILDHCGLARSVEVDEELHIHIGEGFFTPNSVDGHAEGCTEINDSNKESNLQSSGECCCKVMPSRVRCTFGRLTVIRCDGQPCARVIEILNDKVVLSILFELEEKRRESQAGSTDGSSTSSITQRRSFLEGRCLLSVARCPLHHWMLPRPHMTAHELQAPRTKEEGCSLCDSKTCCTDFLTASMTGLP